MAVDPKHLPESSSSDSLESPQCVADAPTGEFEQVRRAFRGNLPPRLPLRYRPSQRNHRELFEKGFAQTADPWSFYAKLTQTHQSGPAYSVSHLIAPFSVRVVKEVRLPGVTIPQRVVRPSHPNIVDLIEIFICEKSLHMVYETMAVSLAQIPAGSWGETVDADVAFVCGEVIASTIVASTLTTQKILQGLMYIRSDLCLSYGRFGPDDILLSASGQVKLGK